MDPPSASEWRLIQQLFEEALELSASERSQFLKQATDNQAVISEVSEMLAVFEEEAPELEVPTHVGFDTNFLSGQPIVAASDAVEGYEIQSEIHRGGQGVVYRAIQASTKRVVALKFMHSGVYARESIKKRFEREVELASSLRHPGIVRVFDSGLTSGQYYYVMDYIDGLCLDDYVNAKQLSARETAGLFVPICEAVNYAHQRGVIHRDLKPSNVLVDKEGQCHIVDFGLAKPGNPDSQEIQKLSLTGQVMGTLHYMSPEQARGESDAVDTRSDVYSLGVMLYRLLSGQLPYDLSGSLGQDLLTIQNCPPKTLPDISSELSTISLKALSKEPDRRYQTAGELGRDIQRFLRGETIEAKRDSVLYVVRKTLQRHRLATSVAVLFALLVCTSAITGWGLFLDARRARNDEFVASQNYRRERDAARKLREESHRQLYFSQMNLAGQVASEQFGIDTIRSALEPWNPSRRDDVDLRGWEWYYLNGFSHQEEFQSEQLKGWSWEADYNHDCSEFVVAIGGWGLQVRDASTGAIRREKFTGSARSIDWSDDGTRIVMGNMRGEVELFDAQTLRSIWKCNVGIGRSICPVRFSPDGKFIAVSSVQEAGREFVPILNSMDGSKVNHVSQPVGLVQEIQWSPDSSRIATSLRTGTVSVSEVSTGKLIRELPDTVDSGRGGGTKAIAWRKDGLALAIGSPLRIWELDSGKESSLPIRSRVLSIDWNPNDTSLACACDDGVVRVTEADGRVTHEFRGHTSSCNSVRWSADGSQLLSCGLKDLTVRTWRAKWASRTQRIPIANNPVGVKGLTWSPNGEFIAFTQHYDATVEIWNVLDRKRVMTFEMPDISSDRLAFSPNGRFLAWTSQAGAHLLDLESRASSLLAESPKQSATVLSWHPDGQLAVAFRQPEARIVVWDSSGQKRAEFAGESGIVASSLAWDTSGSRLAMAGAISGNLGVWNIGSSRPQWNLEAGNVGQVLWSNDEKTLITSTRGAIVIRDSETGGEVQRLDEIQEAFSSMAYSPQADRLAVGSSSSLSIWSLDPGLVTIKFMGAVVGDVQWSPDGQCVAAACGDGVYLWDAAPGHSD